MTRINYTKEMLQSAVDESVSVMGVLEKLGLKKAGGTHAHIKKKLDSYGIDVSHFTGQAHMRGKRAGSKKTAEQILVFLPPDSPKTPAYRLRRALLESDIEHVCKECGLDSIWNGKPITLEIDHIDGDWLNNLISNLRFLCPNCHSQQTTTNTPWKFRK